MSNSSEKNQNKSSVTTSDTLEPGTLFIVATPIGNLEDITQRAIRVLSEADVILAEDTRHSTPLLRHYGISTRAYAFHDHNEDEKTPMILDMLAQGKKVALISDAGTPLISDPGYGLVHAAMQAAYKIEPIPGACAVVTALSASGLPTDQFYFAGFTPSKTQQRNNFLKQYIDHSCTLVFYEASHRIEKSIASFYEVFGDRVATVARELTKKFETIKTAPLSELVEFIRNDANQQKGEFVIIVTGKPKVSDNEEAEIERCLTVLLESLSVSQAVDITTKLHGVKKNPTYKLAIKLAEEMEGSES